MRYKEKLFHWFLDRPSSAKSRPMCVMCFTLPCKRVQQWGTLIQQRQISGRFSLHGQRLPEEPPLLRFLSSTLKSCSSMFPGMGTSFQQKSPFRTRSLAKELHKHLRRPSWRQEPDASCDMGSGLARARDDGGTRKPMQSPGDPQKPSWREVRKACLRLFEADPEHEHGVLQALTADALKAAFRRQAQTGHRESQGGVLCFSSKPCPAGHPACELVC